jgi:selenide,water dikinase
VDEVLELFAREGFGHAAVIGRMVQGAPRIAVSA